MFALTLFIDRDFLFDEDSHPELTLIRLTDRGDLKYPSEFILDFITTLWKILIAIERNDKLMKNFMQKGSSIMEPTGPIYSCLLPV